MFSKKEMGSSLASSTKKYKGLKGLSSFNGGSQGLNFSRSNVHEQINKLDDLLTNYQFSYSMGSSFGSLNGEMKLSQSNLSDTEENKRK